MVADVGGEDVGELQVNRGREGGREGWCIVPFLPRFMFPFLSYP